MEEIVGDSALNAVLNLADLSAHVEHFPPHDQDLQIPFSHIGRLQEGLERVYGPRGGRGVALRTGQVCFKYGLREFGPELGLTDLAFRLLPLQAKIRTGSEALAGLFNRMTDQRVRVSWEQEKLTWHIDRCPLCTGRKTSDPCCHLAVGLLQEALYWVSGGKFFQVEETGCIARGDSACTIVIDPEPVS